MAELKLQGDRPQLLSLEECFFNPEDLKEEKQLFILKKCQEIQQKHQGQTPYFCYGLPQSLVTSFLFSFPFKEKFKILKTLPFEIEDKSPFRPDKTLFDARISKITDKKASSALCFVTPEDNAREFLELIKKPKPYLLSCEGSALANLLESWNKPLSHIQNPKTHTLFIYLGADHSLLLFYKEGHLTHISVLEWGVSGLIKEMARLYKLTEQKAWEEFFKKVLYSDLG